MDCSNWWVRACFLLAALVPATAFAEAVLQVLPTRVLMDDDKRAQSVTLVNRGDTPGTYRLFFRNMRVSSEGRFEEVKEPLEGELFSDNMVRFSPRRITVPAQSKQSVRVLVRKPADLAPGEYRSHLVFRKMPTDDDAQTLIQTELGENAVGFSLKPIVEVTIPVIVRHGDLQANLSLSSLKLIQDGTQPAAQITIHRAGTRSIYGDVDLFHRTDGQEDRLISFARGVSVYTPNDIRKFSLPLEAKPPASGSLVLEFREDPEYGGELTAQIEAQL